jgi:hypothetical protein
MSTVEIISNDISEPIILIRDYPVDEFSNILKNKTLFEEDHKTRYDYSYEPTVKKQCVNIKVQNTPNLSTNAILLAAQHCDQQMANFLTMASKRKYWGEPSIMVYNDTGYMTRHKDRAPVNEETGRPLNDGLLISANLGLSCIFSFRKNNGDVYEVIVPHGSILIFDAVMTEHAVKVIPNSFESTEYPLLEKFRLSVISRQAL